MWISIDTICITHPPLTNSSHTWCFAPKYWKYEYIIISIPLDQSRVSPYDYNVVLEFLNLTQFLYLIDLSEPQEKEQEENRMLVCDYFSTFLSLSDNVMQNKPTEHKERKKKTIKYSIVYYKLWYEWNFKLKKKQIRPFFEKFVCDFFSFSFFLFFSFSLFPLSSTHVIIKEKYIRVQYDRWSVMFDM